MDSLTRENVETNIEESNPELDGQKLKELIYAAYTWLKTNQQTVNSLNVFPVPDGDTGTNMVLTMQAAYDEISNSKETNIGKMAHKVAQGALMGARGNSGVILSQLWRGFSRILDNHPLMDSSLFVKALGEAKQTAYKGVVRPVEGTILTVAKDMSIEAEKILPDTSSLKELFDKIIQAADESVERTPDLLPILKQAGVVDSGGKGLFYILEGMQRYLQGEPLDSPLTSVQPLSAMISGEHIEIEEGQDYEIVVDFTPDNPIDLENFYENLSEFGTSIQVGEGDKMYRMHIHVPEENRYTPIDYIMGLGTVTKVLIENLMAQMEGEEKSTASINLQKIEPGQIAVVAVSPGTGISKIFASLGVSSLVEGGQTMNPSTEEILNSFENLPTNNVIILPNNKNILLAAQAAAQVTVKNVAVIPTLNVPQGLSAILRLDPDGDFDNIVEEMIEAKDEPDTGEITIANRTVEINGVDVKEGSVIALHNGKLVESTPNLEEACINLLKLADSDERERITLFYGKNISKNNVNHIVDAIRSEFQEYEIELHEGGQPHYQFIISIE
ncbi:MAG: DAK2 domain-containing protein [Bacteroidales bacterium]|nr:DAK2 domain-containing protein [Bacteroidales bacterium]